MSKNYYNDIKESYSEELLKEQAAGMGAKVGKSLLSLLGPMLGLGLAGGLAGGLAYGATDLFGGLGDLAKSFGSSAKPLQSRVNIDAARALSRGDDSAFTDYRGELQNSGMGLNARTRALSRTKSEAANIARRNAAKLKPLALSDKTPEGRAYLAARKAYEDAKKSGTRTITDPEEKAQVMAAGGDDASKASMTRPLNADELRKLREAEKAARKAALDRQYTIGELEDAGIQLEKVNFYKKIIAEQMAGEIPMGPGAGVQLEPEETSMAEENKKREAEQQAAAKAAADAETKRRSRTVSYTGTATRRNELSTPSAKFYSQSEATKDYPSGEQVMADQAERERQIRLGKISKTFKERGWEMPGTPEWDRANESPKDRMSRIQAELSAERAKIEAEERAKLDAEQPARDYDLEDAEFYNIQTGNRGYTTPEQRDIGRHQRKIDTETKIRKEKERKEKERKAEEEMEAMRATLSRRLPGEKEYAIALKSPEERAAAMAASGDSESEAFFNLYAQDLPRRPARYPGGPGPVFDGPEPNYVEITPEQQFSVTKQNVKREVPKALVDLEKARKNNEKQQQELEDLHNKHMGPLPFSVQNEKPANYIEISPKDKKEVERQRTVNMEAEIKKELERLEKERKQLEVEVKTPKPPSLLAVPGAEKEINPKDKLSSIEDTIQKLLKQLQAGNLVEK